MDFYDRQALGLGGEFAAEVQHTLETLLDFPELGHAHLASTRRVLIPRFPYSLVYRLKPEQIDIIAVPHHRRKPGYWRKRR